MGGHGGLNILPQKRWNVYNYDNRERVRKDEEAAAREEHIRRQQERQNEAEARLAKLREAANGKRDPNPLPCSESGIVSDNVVSLRDILAPSSTSTTEEMQQSLFEGLISFKQVDRKNSGGKEFKGSYEIDKEIFRGDKELERLYKRAAKEATKVGKDGVDADDEKYRLGYGCLGRDKTQPWYLTKNCLMDGLSDERSNKDDQTDAPVLQSVKRRKSIEELREERLKREQQERAKARRLLAPVSARHPPMNGDRKRQPYYNSSFGNAR